MARQRVKQSVDSSAQLQQAVIEAMGARAAVLVELSRWTGAADVAASAAATEVQNVMRHLQRQHGFFSSRVTCWL